MCSEHVIQHEILIIWFVSYSVLQVLRYALVSAYDRISPDDYSVRKWGWWFSLTTALSALHWGMAGVFFFAPDSPVHQAVLAIFVAGISCAVTVVYAYVTISYVSILLCALGPASARFLYEGNETSVILRMAGLSFGAVMIIAGRRLHNIVIGNLTLGLEKNDLIDSLSEQKSQTEGFNGRTQRGNRGAQTGGRSFTA